MSLIQVDQARSGINALALSQKTINMLRENFVAIEKYALIFSFWVYSLVLLDSHLCSHSLVIIIIIKHSYFLKQVMQWVPNTNWESWQDKAS